jgi:membrane protein
MSKKSQLSSVRSLRWNEVFQILKKTVIEFTNEKSLFHGAALSYYTILSLVPILYLSIVSFGQFIGQKTMVAIISNVLHEQVGIQDVKGILEFLNEIDFEKSNWALQIIGIVVLMVSATAMLSSLKNSINEFFDIERVHATKKKQFLSTLLDKVMHLSLLMIFGLIIVLTYFAQTIIVSFGDKIFSSFDELFNVFVFLTQHAVPFMTNFLIFFFIFRYLHDGIIARKLAVYGSLFTTTLLYLGQLLIKFYLLHYFFAKDAGIAGTILILLTWVYYTSQIIFLGAKFTAVFAKVSGSEIKVKQ